MGNTKVIITMGGLAVGSCLIEKLCYALGKTDIAQCVSVVTISLAGATVATASYNLLNTVSKCITGGSGGW